MRWAYWLVVVVLLLAALSAFSAITLAFVWCLGKGPGLAAAFVVAVALTAWAIGEGLKRTD